MSILEQLTSGKKHIKEKYLSEGTVSGNFDIRSSGLIIPYYVPRVGEKRR